MKAEEASDLIYGRCKDGRKHGEWRVSPTRDDEKIPEPTVRRRPQG
jgi:hypothetical protein